jgi:hypothetical protein
MSEPLRIRAKHARSAHFIGLSSKQKTFPRPRFESRLAGQSHAVPVYRSWADKPLPYPTAWAVNPSHVRGRSPADYTKPTKGDLMPEINSQDAA